MQAFLFKVYETQMGSWTADLKIQGFKMGKAGGCCLYLPYPIMLLLKPNCEHCGTLLPNNSEDAMICSYECTFCRNCVADLLENVCPNCGGGFVQRPPRPAMGLRRHPASTVTHLKPIDMQAFLPLKKRLVHLAPTER